MCNLVFFAKVAIINTTTTCVAANSYRPRVKLISSGNM